MSVALNVASRLGLFSRTFLLLTVLMTASLAAWLQAFRSMEMEPRAQQVAQQIVTVVNITRTALVHAAPLERRDLLLDLATNEGIQIYPRDKDDTTQPLPDRQVLQRMEQQVATRLGPETHMAWEVNNIPGLWVSFTIDKDNYWMVMERDRAERVPGVEWLGWGAVALLLSLLGAAVIVGFVNRPLSRLARATLALSRGDTPAPLPESGPEELRQVNTNFNRMVAELDRAETDRALMLAGISHDLRTPLARLRLEVELSGVSEASRAAIDEDLGQIDRTIGQFMEYARPPDATDQFYNVSALVAEIVERERSHTETLGGRLEADIAPNLWARVTCADLQRAVSNLLENARRYGHQSDRAPRIALALTQQGQNVQIDVADRGPGIKPEDVPRLLRPFTRGSDARTNAGGAGLGLAIVRRLLLRSGGRLQLLPRDGGGLVARITLPLATAPQSMNAFVYGTLRRGEINDIEDLARRLGLAAPRRLGLARVPGRLVDFGDWPGLIDGADAAVLGEVYGIDAALLAAMDEVEEYLPGQDTLFVRRTTEVVIDGRAVPCHYYPIEPRLMGDARPIASGDWVAYRLARG